MVITSQQFSILLEPGLRNIWHDSWPPREQQFTQIANVGQMSKLTVTDAKLADFGALQTQNEGASIIYDDPLTPVTVDYTKTTRALGYRITDDMIRGELYGQVARFERGLMRSAQHDLETAFFGLFNNGFTTTNTGFDGLALFSTAHTRMDGGSTQSNRHSSDVALSLSGLHDAIIQFRNWVNERGFPVIVQPKTLLVPPDLMMTAFELLESEGKPGTANNDANVVRRFGIQPMVGDYLTSSTAWFLIGDEHDLNFLWWFRPESGQETDFDTDDVKRKVRQAYAVGFGEWLGTWGSNAS